MRAPTQSIRSEKLVRIVRDAVRAFAIALDSPELDFWDTDLRATVALRQGARAGANLRQLLTAIKALGHVYKQEGFTGRRLDSEVGPFRFRANLRDTLRKIVACE